MNLITRLFRRPPSRNAFAQRVASALTAAGLAETVAYDRDAFALRLGQGSAEQTDQTVSLHALYAEYCSLPRRRRQEVVRGLVTALQDASAPVVAAGVHGQLCLRLQPRGWAERTRTGSQGEVGLVHQVVAGNLALCLCVDLPTAVRYVGGRDLQDWGLDPAAAFTIARANLARMTEGSLVEQQPGLYRSSWQDSYDAARVALPWLIERVPAPGGHVVAVPNRECLLVAGLADAAAVAALAAETERAFDHPRSITPQLYQLVAGTLQPLRLPDEHPIHEVATRLEALARVHEYAEQKHALDAPYQAEGTDVYVAIVDALKSPSGVFCTYAVWPAGVDMLLPETDLLALVGPAPDGKDAEAAPLLGVFPFERVRAVAGSLLEPLGVYPPRYRARVFLSSDQLRALGEPIEGLPRMSRAD